MPPFMTSAEDLSACLDQLNFFHMDLSLDRVTKAMRPLVLSDPPYFVIQIVGTNGKGSTAAFLTSLLQEHGLRTGLFTSPHFCSPAERIQIDGQWTDMTTWLDTANLCLSLQPDLTYFELMTVIALDVFRKAQVDCVILEAGLGARHDATTATVAHCVCVTPIALDHTDVLGPDIAAIAAEKACAIRSAAPVVTAPQTPEALARLQARADAFHAPLVQAQPLGPGARLGLAGPHQRLNAGLALQTFRTVAPLLHVTPRESAVFHALTRTFLPGRLQHLPAREAMGGAPDRPPCLLDGAHNPHGMTALVKALADEETPDPSVVVFSSLRDKNWRESLTLLARALPGRRWLIPALTGERAEDPARIAEHLKSLGQTEIVTPGSCRDCFAELARREETGTVLVTGSLYLLGDFFAIWPEALHTSA